MQILAIDTATEACSVALWKNGNTFASFEKCPRQHTKRILSILVNILRQGNTTLTELNALAFSRGPGSFTGVRIGVGISQGLALGANLPMISISTLAMMAQGAFRKIGATKVLSAIDARMNQVYWGEYIRDSKDIWHGEETETVYELEEINSRLKNLHGEWAIVGTGWKPWLKMKYNSQLKLTNGNTLLPTAEDMLPIAHQLLLAKKTVAVEHAKPVYLRNEIVKKS